MAEVQLQAAKREAQGKGAARQARMAGKVPAVLYGRQLDPVAIEVDRRSFVVGAEHRRRDERPARDPARGRFRDRADQGPPDRPRRRNGSARRLHPGRRDPGHRGVRAGPHRGRGSREPKRAASVDQTLHEVAISVRPDQVPEAIDADISALNIGDSLRVSELRGPRALTRSSTDPEEVVLAVVAPISEEELAALEAEAGIVQEPTDAEEAAAEEAAAAEGGEEAPAEPSEEASE